MVKVKIMGEHCKKIEVPKEVCYLSFGKDKTDHSWDGTQLVKKRKGLKVVGKYFETVRGEQIIIDFNKKNKIIGIELLGSSKARKPCQKG